MKEEVREALFAHWKDLLTEGQNLIFHKGQALFYEGHVPCGLFVLLSGHVQFTREGLPTQDTHLEPAPQGTVVGLEPFSLGTHYCCTCTAIEECRVVFISKTQLLFLKKGEISYDI